MADVDFNLREIVRAADRLEELGVEIAVFPELSITGYTCGDLIHNMTLLTAADRAVEKLRSYSAAHNIHLLVGAPRATSAGLENCAVFIHDGQVDYVAKTYIPNYAEFYERRHWMPAPDSEGLAVFESHGALIGCEICEDLWVAASPSCFSTAAGAHVVFNLSASDELIGKNAFTVRMIKQQSSRCLCGYVYASAGYGESTTDMVFTGKNIIAECGELIAEADRWQTGTHWAIADIDILRIMHSRMHTTTYADCAAHMGITPRPYDIGAATSHFDIDYEPTYRPVDPTPFVPGDPETRARRCEEILRIQTMALRRRMEAIGCKSLTIGISGGLDSTLALLVAVRTFDSLKLPRTGIIGITMPGEATSDRTHDNALRLMNLLGVTSREICIHDAVMQHFGDIDHDPAVHNAAYENAQARERTQILMDVANDTGGIVLGTGDMSELALGWATYNGDHMSMYGINAGVPKTVIPSILTYIAEQHATPEIATILMDVVDTPISPELVPDTDTAVDDGPAQRTEDIVGPYKLHDFFLYMMIRYGFGPRRIFVLARKAFKGIYDSETILHWLTIFTRRFFTQQFKRSCLPDGPKVGSISLSPRGDWRMPSDASHNLWQSQLAEIRSMLTLP